MVKKKSKKKTAAGPSGVEAELYQDVISSIAGVDCKGKAMLYTSHNGHMWSFLAKDKKVSLRLPEKDRDAFLKKYRSKLSVQYGAVMKEYVLIPNTLLKNTTELRKYFMVAYKNVKTLKPKATSKKAKKKTVGKKKTVSKKKTTKKKAVKATKKKTVRTRKKKAVKKK